MDVAGALGEAQVEAAGERDRDDPRRGAAEAVRVARAGRPLADRDASSRACRACRRPRAARPRTWSGAHRRRRPAGTARRSRSRPRRRGPRRARTARRRSPRAPRTPAPVSRPGRPSRAAPRASPARRRRAPRPAPRSRSVLSASEPARAWNVMSARSSASARRPRWRVLRDGEHGVVEAPDEHPLVAGPDDIVAVGIGVDHRQEAGEPPPARRQRQVALVRLHRGHEHAVRQLEVPLVEAPRDHVHALHQVLHLVEHARRVLEVRAELVGDAAEAGLDLASGGARWERSRRPPRAPRRSHPPRAARAPPPPAGARVPCARSGRRPPPPRARRRRAGP